MPRALPRPPTFRFSTRGEYWLNPHDRFHRNGGRRADSHLLEPEGQSDKGRVNDLLESQYGAAVVTGKIRELYLKLDGPKGKLGYPVQDETFSPDHYGRLSIFQHGEIVWNPRKGAQVDYKEPRDEDKNNGE